MAEKDKNTTKICSFNQNLGHKSKKMEEEIIAQVHTSLWPKNDCETLFGLLEQHPDLVDSVYGTCRDTLLIRASRYGKTEAVRKLVSMTAKIDATNINGQTALHVACLNAKEDVVRILLKAGANAYSRNLHNCCPSHLAAKGGSLECLKLIIEYCIVQAGCERAILCKGQYGNTVLHYAVLYGRIEMAKFLIENEALDVNQRNDLSETPLHLASGAYNISVGTVILELLLKSGADLHAITAWGDTAAHYAALSGTLDSLQYLFEAGINLTKDKELESQAWKVCHSHQLSEECEETMKYDLLQKVARSSCINKSVYLINKMMDVRQKINANSCMPHFRRGGYIGTELNCQETQLLELSTEFHRDMAAPDSALKLFLKHTPDALEHLFDRCISSLCETEQVQGKIFFDFFLFCPNPGDCQQMDTGEMTLLQILITHGKAYYLIHPLFETFIRLKWLKTWKLFSTYIFGFLLITIGIIGFGLTHYGQFKTEEPHDFWWFYLCFVSFSYNINLFFFMWSSIPTWKRVRRLRSREFFSKYWTFTNILFTIGDCLLTLVLVTFPFLTLFANSLDPKAQRYISAINIIAACFNLMRLCSRLPDVGVYIFMMKRVTVSILRFFSLYFWHFFGYAIAFHIIMPGEDGTFYKLEDSVIKVLTMLMGEYDFTDNFVGDDTFWLAKLIFVLFVFDMSVVLMNLVIGLAVSDVEAIKRESNVQKLTNETFTVIYLEQQITMFKKMPVIRNLMPKVRIMDKSTCKQYFFYFLDLVDVADNTENSINIDSGPCSEIQFQSKHSCPKSITTNVVEVLRKRLDTSPNKLDPITEQVIRELRTANEKLRHQVKSMDAKLNKLIGLIEDLK